MRLLEPIAMDSRANQATALDWVLVLIVLCLPRLRRRTTGAFDPKRMLPSASSATRTSRRASSSIRPSRWAALSCHEIRVNKDITRVKLITTTPQALCLTCHADKDAAKLKGTVHPPPCATALNVTTRMFPKTRISY